MSVHLNKCSHPLCRRLFELEHFSPSFARQGMAAGVVICPHCGLSAAANPALVYSARPLPNDFEHRPEEDFPAALTREGEPVVSQSGR